MNVWSKLITALRGGANELGEAILDGHALRVLDQEVREAAEELLESKQALATVMAKQKAAERHKLETVEAIAQHEKYVVEALNKKEDALALEIAQKIATLEKTLSEQEALLQRHGQHVTDLRSAVNVAEQNIKRLRQQVDTVRATENVQRAQAALVQRYQASESSKLRTAMDSVEAIRRKQQERAAHIEAAAELEGDAEDDRLLKKLADAGIVSKHHDAEDVLARIKKQAKKL